MQLIITEKHDAARRIAEILSEGSATVRSGHDVNVYEWDESVCIGLSGHVVGVDFPDEYGDWRDVEPVELLHAPIETRETRPEIVRAVRRLARDADRVVIATDYDREGELIGKEAYDLVREVAPEVPVDRVRFSSITAREVTGAFAAPDEIDFDLAAAGEARQVVDLVWGAALTRFLSLSAGRLGQDFISVGRVQSPTLKLIVDREREIEAFDPETYWELFADLADDADEQFEAQYFYLDEEDNEAERVWEHAQAEAVYADLSHAESATVTAVRERTRTDAPPAPFNTTQYIRAAGAIGFSAQRAMSIAEDLYTAGYITYPRTDNTVYPDDLDPRALLSTLAEHPAFGEDADSLLAAESITPTRGDAETTDHPPIHPTAELADRGDLSNDEWRVYELVVRRFFATVADPAIWKHLRVVATVADHRLKANGKRLVQPGYHAVYPYFKTDENIVPLVEEGQELVVVDTELAEKETQPPRRYGQSRLIETMEDLGLGTKCLTADSNVLVRDEDGDVRSTAIRGIFERGQRLVADGDVDIVSNDRPVTTLSLDETTNRIDERRTALVSERDVRADETVYRFRTERGSFSVTEDHPMYVWNDDHISIVPAAEVGVGDELVATRAPNTPERVEDGGLVMTWDTFAADCDESSQIHGTGHRSIEAQIEKRAEPICSISNRVGTHASAPRDVDRTDIDAPVWLRRELSIKPDELDGVNVTTGIQNPFPLRWSHELARVVGAMLGDGSTHINQDEDVVDLRYVHTDSVRAERFAADIEALFDHHPSVDVRPGGKGHPVSTYQVRLPAVTGRLLIRVIRTLREDGLTEIPDAFHPSFVGGIFDDGGHISREGNACISNRDHALLTEIQQVLSRMGIDSTRSRAQHRLHIRGRRNLERFLDRVPIATDDAFYRGCDGLQSYPVTLRKARILRSIRETPKTTEELAMAVGTGVGAIRTALRELCADGHAEQCIEGSNRGGDGNRIVPYVAIDYDSTIYSTLMGDPSRAIVRSREERDYDAPVYDLTVAEDAPNFALQGGIIVHNSTRHHTIEKLYDRGYLEDDPPRPTQLAKAVVDAAEKYAELVTSEEMTAQLEEDMAAIAAGEATYADVTEESRAMLDRIFEDLMDSHDEIGDHIRESLRRDRTVGPCPECGSDLLLRQSKRGSTFIGCDGYPACEYTLPLPNDGKPVLLEERCETHEMREIKLLAGRNTRVHGCPLCKVEEADRTEDRVIGACPDCGDSEGGELAIKQLRNGSRLVGCTRYPDCEYSLPLPRRGEIAIQQERCEEHDLPELVVDTGDEPWELGCPICNYREYQARERDGSELERLSGLGEKTAEKLAAAGIESLDDLRAAEPETLAADVDGVSAERIREWQAEA